VPSVRLSKTKKRRKIRERGRHAKSGYAIINEQTITWCSSKPSARKKDRPRLHLKKKFGPWTKAYERDVRTVGKLYIQKRNAKGQRAKRSASQRRAGNGEKQEEEKAAGSSRVSIKVL